MRWHFQVGLVCLALAIALSEPFPRSFSQDDDQTPVMRQSHLQLSLPAASSPAAPPLPIEEYWQLVRDTQELIVDLTDLPPDVVRARLQGTATQWENVETVLLPDNTVVPVDHSFIVSQLRSDEPDLGALEALLNALLAESASWPIGKFSEADIRALEDILERAEFQWKPAKPSLLQEWWRKVQRSVAELLARIFGDSGIEAGFSVLEYLLFGLGMATIILVLVYALRGMRMSIIQETELDADDLLGDEGLDADSALHKAQELSSQGDYRQAVRYLYLSSLLLLEERGLLRYDRSRTNREYLRSVAHQPELSASLSEVVDVFDRVWYGYQSLDQATFEHYSNQVINLRRQR